MTSSTNGHGTVEVLDPFEPALPPPPEVRRARGLGRIVAQARNWGELRHSPHGMAPVVVLGLINFFQIFDTATFSVAAPEIAQDLGISLQGILGVISIVAFFAVFAQLLMGYYADRHNRVRIFALGTLLSGLFSVVSSTARSTFTLGLPRVLDDVSNRAAEVPSLSLMADYYPPASRGKAFALLGVLGNVGGLLAPVLAAVCVTQIGWRPTTVAFGLPLVAMGAVAFFRLREPVRGYFERTALGLDDDVAGIEDEPKSLGEAFRAIFAVRTLRRLFLALIWVNGAAMVFTSIFAFYLAEEFGLNSQERIVVFLPASILGTVGAFLGGGLVDYFARHNPGRVILVFSSFYLLGAAGMAGVAAGFGLLPIIVFFSLSALGSAMVGPATGAVFAQIIPPAVRSQGLQVIALSALPGLLVLPQIAGRMQAEYGYTAALALPIPLILIGAAIAASSAKFFDFDMRAAFATAQAAEQWRQARADGNGKLLVCYGVDVAYDGVQVLFDVDFDVDEGEIVALLGTNGAGKSTLLRAISGTREASGGAIVFDGRDITHMPPHEIAARRVIHMPGGRGVFPGLTVRENLALGRWLTKEEERSEAQSRMAEVFRLFPILRSRADEPAGALSGGEQQMLSLAQAFLARPRLLLIDELSLGLSPAMVGQLVDVVKELNRRGTTIIVVEQSINVALTLADRAVFMEKGEVRFHGPTSDLLQRPDILRSVYVKGTSGGLATGVVSRARAAGSGEVPPILDVRGVSRRFGGITAVDDVSLAVPDNAIVGLIGPNGAGKTTLFDLISGYQVPDDGTISFDGLDITHMAPEERARRKLLRRFQDARLFPSLTVFEALLVALDDRQEVRGTVLHALAAPQARKSERRLRAKADALVDILGLGSYRDKFVRELSTGLRRIVDLACVLAVEPRLVLLDEPSAGIAQSEVEAMAPLLRRVRHETGCAILVIEHSIPLIASISDELVALELGRVIARGRPQDVLDDERVVQSYLGDNEAAIKREGALS